MPITVLSSNTDTAFLASLHTVLDSCEAMSLLESDWSNDTQLLKIVRELKPDVLLMDGQLHVDNKTSLLLQLGAVSPGTKIIMLFDFLNQRDVIEAIVQGAKGCICKKSSSQQWLKAIQVIHGGDLWVDRKALVGGLNNLLHPELNPLHLFESKPEILTTREWEVVVCAGQGMTNKEIARQLIISTTTVKTHLQNIFSKLKVGRRMQLPQAQMSTAMNVKKTTTLQTDIRSS